MNYVYMIVWIDWDVYEHAGPFTHRSTAIAAKRRLKLGDEWVIEKWPLYASIREFENETLSAPQ